MKIVLCVAVSDGGEGFLRVLAESAARLASGAHAVELDFTCHSEAQQVANRRHALALKIGRSHIVAREHGSYFHVNSVTHSRCINALFESVEADVAIICDFDMAFVQQNWDQLLVDRIIRQNVAILGSPYATDAGFNFSLGRLSVYAQKYQRKPNCIFMAFSPQRLRSLSNRLCDFSSDYGDPNSIPLKFVSNGIEARQYGLPVGSFVHLDTGSRVPVLIEKHGLDTVALERRTKLYAVLKSARFPNDYPPFLYPEEYFIESRPFVVHFRKGSSKAAANSYGIAQFEKDVEAWNGSITAPNAEPITTRK